MFFSLNCESENNDSDDSQPSIAELTSDYKIYVSDAGNFSDPPWQILVYDHLGKNPEVFIDENLAWPQDILFLEDENEVLISNLNSGRITRYNLSGEYIDDFANGLNGPTRMKIGPDGKLYVIQWRGNGYVLRYELDGTFIDEFTDVAVPQAIGIDWDSDGNLYVSSFRDINVRKFDSAGNDLGLFVTDNLLGPTNIWFDASGNLLVNDWRGGVIAKFKSSGEFKERFSFGLNEVEGISILPDSSFLVGNGGTSSIKHFASDGSYLRDLIPRRSGGLIKPNAVVIRKSN